MALEDDQQCCVENNSAGMEWVRCGGQISLSTIVQAARNDESRPNLEYNL